LRKQGVSVRVIATQLGVSRSSVSAWVRDLVLTRGQLEVLKKSSLQGAEIGRFKSAEIRRGRRESFIRQQMLLGKENISALTERELLYAGLALYWGEGSKKNGAVQFCNSDPKMIQFIIIWLQKCFEIKKEELTFWVGINEDHRYRDKAVKEYWANETGVSLSQFANTSFKKIVNKKVYDNFEEHYGTVFLRVARPARYYYKILGMIEGMSQMSA